MTAGADGNPTSSVYLYEPFGQPSSSVTFGTNSNPANSTNQSMGWAANPTRKVEGLFTVAIIQMGARVYLPSLARFLQVDPVEGGTANGYVYVGDPINGNDYTGRCWSHFGWFCSAAHSASNAVKGLASKVGRKISSFFTPSDSETLTRVVPDSGLYVKGAGSSAFETAQSVAYGSNAVKSSGIYRYTDNNGRTYTGMTSRTIATRTQEHIRDGDISPTTEVEYISMPGASKLELRIAEQNNINLSGGVDGFDIGNKVNSIKEDDWFEFDIDPPLPIE